MSIARQRRRLGNSAIEVSSVGLGCWPMAGMTTIGANSSDSLDTIRAAFDAGINFLDTAFAYGAAGESDAVIAKFLPECERSDLVVATKGGIHWDADGKRVNDARPAVLRSELEQSLERLRTDYVDLFYLHAPDPNVPIAESAGGCRELLESGLARTIGVSNVDVSQLDAFTAECPIVACQPPYNILQRGIESDIIPWCKEHSVSVVTYWPLMKGLLAGKLKRDHQFAEKDSRKNYEVFQGKQWELNQDFVDVLREISRESGHSVAEIVVNWTINQPGITTALCGAKRADQIRETARAMTWSIADGHLQKIQSAFELREQKLAN